MSIEEQFKNVKSVQELHMLMRQLKAEGCNATEVNMYASKRRKELLMLNNKRVSKLKKVIPPITKDAGVQFVSFNVSPKHVNNNVINIQKEVIEI